MDTSKQLISRSNPLRSDLDWRVIAVQAVVVAALGIYALTNESSALRNVVFIVGLFLLVNGILTGMRGMRAGTTSPGARFMLIRSGIAIATGAIVVLDRITDFIDLNPSRVIAGLGLIGMGVLSLMGIVATREEGSLRIGAVVFALLFAIWGIVMIYQAANDSNSMALFGWIAIIIGVGLAALALFRRQSALGEPAAVPAAQ